MAHRRITGVNPCNEIMVLAMDELDQVIGSRFLSVTGNMPIIMHRCMYIPGCERHYTFPSVEGCRVWELGLKIVDNFLASVFTAFIEVSQWNLQRKNAYHIIPFYIEQLLWEKVQSFCGSINYASA